jgi:hypothetical protein
MYKRKENGEDHVCVPECFNSRTAGRISTTFGIIIMPIRPVQLLHLKWVITESRDCEVEATRVPVPMSGKFSNQ